MLKTIAFLLLSSFSIHAENWAQWRGPAFNGSSPETGLPDSFSVDDADAKTTRKNVAWICDMPGASNATPVIADDKVFVTSTNYINHLAEGGGKKPAAKKGAETGGELFAICIDRKTGKILWQKTAAQSPTKDVSNTGKNTLASCSPVTDGKQVVFTFGTGDIVCYDINGAELWRRNLGKDFGEITLLHGYSSTPLLYKEKLYIQMLRRDRLEARGGTQADPKLDSFILAVDWKTGKDIFKAPRKSTAKDGECESYSSPIVYERQGRPEILISGSLWVSGHDPENGKEYWHWGTLTPWITGNVRSVSEPVATNDFVFAAGPRTRPVFAIKAGGTGDMTKDGKAWEFKDHDCAVASPALYDGFLYLLDAGKRKLTCMEPASGKVKWSGSVESAEDHADFSSSPAIADGKIYLMNERGNVVIVSTREFKILDRVMLDEGYTASSPAIAHGHVFFRTAKRLYCVGK